VSELESFSRQLIALQAKYPNKGDFEAAYAFLDLHLKWADAARSSNPKLAVEQYLLAEDCQSTIGTFATGSGEGLASMAALYAIMGKRADLEEKCADSNTVSAAEKVKHLNNAVSIWSKIAADPNGQGDDTAAKSSLARLRQKIDQRC
jgi:hypothetical protein